MSAPILNTEETFVVAGELNKSSAALRYFAVDQSLRNRQLGTTGMVLGAEPLPRAIRMQDESYMRGIDKNTISASGPLPPEQVPLREYVGNSGLGGLRVCSLSSLHALYSYRADSEQGYHRITRWAYTTSSSTRPISQPQSVTVPPIRHGSLRSNGRRGADSSQPRDHQHACSESPRWGEWQWQRSPGTSETYRQQRERGREAIGESLPSLPPSDNLHFGVSFVCASC